MAGLLAIEGNGYQVLLQLYCVAITFACIAVATAVILKIVDLLVVLRVDDGSEREGLDIRVHRESVGLIESIHYEPRGGRGSRRFAPSCSFSSGGFTEFPAHDTNLAGFALRSHQS